MKKKFLITMFACLMATIVFAQSNYQDVVYLKNGSIIRGVIIEQVPNESLKIETADGNLFVYKIDEVEKMTKERSILQTSQSALKKQKSEQSLNYDDVGIRKWYISLNAGANLIGDVVFPGGGFELGYYINPQNLLSVEVGFGGYTEQKLGSFSYTITYSNGNQEFYNDGQINYQYTTVLFLTSWSRIVDLSNKFQWRIGPSIGTISISGADSYTPTEVRGVKIGGLPEPQSIYQGAFAFGVNTGITWNFSKNKRWFLDLGYRLYGNTGISFEKRQLNILGKNITVDEKEFSKISNHISFTVGWRFGKTY